MGERFHPRDRQYYFLNGKSSEKHRFCYRYLYWVYAWKVATNIRQPCGPPKRQICVANATTNIVHCPVPQQNLRIHVLKSTTNIFSRGNYHSKSNEARSSYVRDNSQQLVVVVTFKFD